MKKVFYLVSLASMFMFAACSSDNDEIIEEQNKPVENEGMEIVVGLPGSDGTRVATNDLTNMTWEVGDILMAYPYTDWGGDITPELTFECTKLIAGTNNAVFKTEQTPTEFTDQFIFVYKGSDKIKAERVYNNTLNKPTIVTSCEFVGQEQTTANSEHIKNYLALVSDLKKVSELSNGVIVLKPQMSVFKLSLQNLPKDIQSASEFSVNVYLNYNPESTSTPVASIKYTGTALATTPLYIAFNPDAKLDAKKDIAIEVTANKKNFVTKQTSNNGKSYAEGKIYTITVDNKWSWTDITPEALPLGYAAVFNSEKVMNTWKPLSEQPWDFMQYESGGMRFNRYDRKAEVIYIVSPNIQLGSSNSVNYTYKGWYFGSWDDAKLVVRKKGTTNWIDLIGNVKRPLQYEFVNSENLNIPADLNNQIVEFAFRYNWDGTHAGYWVIQDITVSAQ